MITKLFLLILIIFTINNCDEDSAPRHPLQGGGGDGPLILSNFFCDSRFQEIHYTIGEHSGIANSLNRVAGKIENRCETSNGTWISNDNGRIFKFHFEKNSENECEEPEYTIELIGCEYFEEDSPSFEISNSYSNEIFQYGCIQEINEDIIDLNCKTLIED